MSSRILFNPVATIRLGFDTTATPAGTNVPVGTWIQVVAAMSHASSAAEIYNGSDSTLLISTGAAGLEAASAIPYQILPGRSVVLPVEISRGKRISVTAVDTPATVESMVINFFG